MKVKVKLMNEKAVVPFKKYPSDFGYDCVAIAEKELAPNVWEYTLGLAFQIVRDSEELERGHSLVDMRGIGVGFVPGKYFDFSESPILLDIDARPRSSVWKTGMSLSNCEATLDENFRGYIKAVFYHVMPNMPRYKVGDKVVQIKLGISLPMEFEVVDKLDDTDRGTKGWGSTGLKLEMKNE